MSIVKKFMRRGVALETFLHEFFYELRRQRAFDGKLSDKGRNKTSLRKKGKGLVLHIQG